MDTNCFKTNYRESINAIAASYEVTITLEIQKKKNRNIGNDTQYNVISFFYRD